MFQFFKTFLTIFIIPLFLQTWTRAQTLPTQLQTKEALQIVGNFLKEKESSSWLADIAASRTSPLTTEELMKEIVNSTRASADVKKSAGIVKLAIEEQKRTGKIDESLAAGPEGWKELIDNVENQDDIICLYRKSSNVSSEKSSDWQKFLKNVSPGYTVHLALDMGQKYVLCMKKLQVPEFNSTGTTEVPSTTTIKSTDTEFLTNDSRKNLAGTSTTSESPGAMILDAVMPFVNNIIASPEKKKDEDDDDDDVDCESNESGCSEESESLSTERESEEFSSNSEESKEFENAGRRRLVYKKEKKSSNVEEKKGDCNRPIIYLLSNYPMPQPTIGHFFAPPTSLGSLRPSIQVPNYQRNPFASVLQKKPIRTENHQKIHPIQNSIPSRIPPVSNCPNGKNCPEKSKKVQQIMPKYRPIRQKVQPQIFSRKELSGQPVNAKFLPHMHHINEKKNGKKYDDSKQIYPDKNSKFNNWRIPRYQGYGKLQFPLWKPQQLNHLGRPFGVQSSHLIKPIWVMPQRSTTTSLKTLSSESPDGTRNKLMKTLDNLHRDHENSSEETVSDSSRQKCTQCSNPCSQPIKLKIQVNSPSKEPINVGIFTEPDQNIQVFGGNPHQPKMNDGQFAGRRNFGGLTNSESESEESVESNETDEDEESVELRKNNIHNNLLDDFDDLKDVVDSRDGK